MALRVALGTLILLTLAPAAVCQETSREPTLHDRPISHWLDQLARECAYEGPDEPGSIAFQVLSELGPDNAAVAGPVAARLAKTTDPDAQQVLVVALGRIGSVPKDAVPTLERLTKHEDPIVRVNAAYLVWRGTGDTSRGWPILMDALAGEEANALAMRLLGWSGRLGIAAAPAVAKYLQKRQMNDAEHAEDPMWREAAAEAAASYRALAAWTLAQMDAMDHLKAIEKALKSEENAHAKPRMAFAVWRLRRDGRGALEIVRAGLRDPNPRVRMHTTQAIADFGPDASALVPDLEAAMTGDDLGVLRCLVLEALAAIGASAAGSVPAILKVMEAHPDDLELLALGLRALGAIGVRSEDVLAGIRKVDEAWGPHEGVGLYVREALRKLSSK